MDRTQQSYGRDIIKGAESGVVPDSPVSQAGGAERRRASIEMRAAVEAAKEEEDDDDPMWYFVDEDGETQGPHPAEHMVHWFSLSVGYIKSDWLVCKDGDAEWDVASSVVNWYN